MGSPEQTAKVEAELCRSKDEDQHDVTLTHDFEIQEKETTQSDFQAKMQDNPSFFNQGIQGAACTSDCPVESVTWHQAAAYCNALTVLPADTCYDCSTGGTTTCTIKQVFEGGKIYSCPGYRLPTEAEWEYAYRAGTEEASYLGPITNCTSMSVKADSLGWYIENSSNAPHQVGQKTPNDWGLYDMAGNVGEWCNDWYTNFLGSAEVIDPWGPPSGNYRAARGGSWSSDAGELRAADRDDNRDPDVQLNTIGFRCVRTR